MGASSLSQYCRWARTAKHRQRSMMGSLRAWRHNAVHAQILDHLPIMVVSMSRNERCNDRPRVQTVDTVNSGGGVLGSNRRERLVCIGERIRSGLQEFLLRPQTLNAFRVNRHLLPKNLRSEIVVRRCDVRYFLRERANPVILCALRGRKGCRSRRKAVFVRRHRLRDSHKLMLEEVQQLILRLYG